MTAVGDSGLTLYGHIQSCNCHKPAQLMAQAGMDAEYVEIDIFSGAQHEPWYLAVNPLGEIPALRDGEHVIGQSPLILKYLSEKSGFMAEADWEAVDFWLTFDQNRILPSAALKRFLLRFGGETSPDVLTFLDGRIDLALGKMERVLDDGRRFLTGETATVADIACSAYLLLIDEANYDASRWGAVSAWLERFKALPGYRSPYDLVPRGNGRLRYSGVC